MSTIITQEEQIDATEVYGCGNQRTSELETKAELFALTSEMPANIDQDIALVVERITQYQASIDNFAAILGSEIKKRLDKIEYLQAKWGPIIRERAIQQIPLKDDGTPAKKSVACGPGKIHFRKTGGWRLDSAEFKSFLSQHPERFDEFGAIWEVKVDRNVVLRHIKDTGEALPGGIFTPPDEFAVMKIGGAKSAWTPRSAYAKLKSILGSQIAEDEDTDDT
jgi:hypothetical protein